MNGRVDNGGRALLPISVKATPQSQATQIDAWIDTGFTGELLMDQALVASLGLVQSGSVQAELGDGSRIVMKTYTCLIGWFGQEQQIEILASSGQYPLLGIGLLKNHQLNVNYPAKTVSVM